MKKYRFRKGWFGGMVYHPNAHFESLDDSVHIEKRSV